MGYYKVVTESLRSLGLRKNPSIMSFPVGEWVLQPEGDIVEGGGDSGGIWVASSLSGARGLRRYMDGKHGVSTRIFEVEIGRVLYENSYRTKTDMVRLVVEVQG